MLYVLSCASRLSIYLSCNEEIRNAFYDFLCSSWICGVGKEQMADFQRQNSSRHYTPVRQYSFKSGKGNEGENKLFLFPEAIVPANCPKLALILTVSSWQWPFPV